eukprot:1435469-Pyramimonas_sp.AAC.1
MGSLRDLSSCVSWSMPSPSSSELRPAGPVHCNDTSSTHCLGCSAGQRALSRSMALCISTARSVVACEQPATMPWNEM